MPSTYFNKYFCKYLLLFCSIKFTIVVICNQWPQNICNWHFYTEMGSHTLWNRILRDCIGTRIFKDCLTSIRNFSSLYTSIVLISSCTFVLKLKLKSKSKSKLELKLKLKLKLKLNLWPIAHKGDKPAN